MSTLMEDDIKRWTAKRKTALVLDIIQGKAWYVGSELPRPERGAKRFALCNFICISGQSVANCPINVFAQKRLLQTVVTTTFAL